MFKSIALSVFHPQNKLFRLYDALTDYKSEKFGKCSFSLNLKFLSRYTIFGSTGT